MQRWLSVTRCTKIALSIRGLEMTRFAMTGAIMFGALMMSGSIDSAAAQNCRDQDTLRSPPGATAATELTFVNAGAESRRIFWIDRNGQRKFYKELGPHASHIQPTFVDHPWVIAREDDRCQTVVIAPAKPMVVDVTRACLTGRIGNNGRCTE